MSRSGNEAISMQIFKPLVAIMCPFPQKARSFPFRPKETIVKVRRAGKANEQVIYFLLPTAASPSFLSLFEAQIIIVTINCIARGGLSSSSPSTTAVNPNL
jgi:hypothetical protein